LKLNQLDNKSYSNLLQTYKSYVKNSENSTPVNKDSQITDKFSNITGSRTFIGLSDSNKTSVRKLLHPDLNEDYIITKKPSGALISMDSHIFEANIAASRSENTGKSLNYELEKEKNNMNYAKAYCKQINKE